MIILFLKLKPLPEKHQSILDILAYVKEQLQLKRGCLESMIYQEWNENPAILYLEQWPSEQEMNRHIQSDIFLRILNTMDLCGEKPEIFFHEVSETKGMEWIASLRRENISLQLR